MSDNGKCPCLSDDGPAQNTDRELWRDTPGDYYSPRLFVTDGGGIGIEVGGFVIVMPLREWHRRATIKGHAQNCQCHTHSAEFEGLPCGGSGLRECYSRVDPRCAQEPSGRVGKHERYFCPRCEQILDKPIHSSLLVPEGTACGPAHLIKPSDPATLAGLLNLTGEERNRKAAPTSAGRCPTCKSSDPKRGVSRSPVTGCPDSFHDRKRKAICPSCGSDDPETTITDDGITTTPADWSCGNCRHPFHTAPQGKEGR